MNALREAIPVRFVSDQRGESLVEALVALLVSTLAILMLANTIASSTNILRAGRNALAHNYEVETSLASIGTTADPKPQLTIVRTSLGSDNSPATSTVSVNFKKGEATGGKEVVAYEVGS